MKAKFNIVRDESIKNPLTMKVHQKVYVDVYTEEELEEYDRAIREIRTDEAQLKQYKYLDTSEADEIAAKVKANHRNSKSLMKKLDGSNIMVAYMLINLFMKPGVNVTNLKKCAINSALRATSEYFDSNEEENFNLYCLEFIRKNIKNFIRNSEASNN